MISWKIKTVLVLAYGAFEMCKAHNLLPYRIYFLYKDLSFSKEIVDYLILKTSFS
tara:strand:- start:930 stop:1094 length:165 start_codon:yes stop_codon:yes gene_type:complete